jgi:5-methyltetrahydrofolate--homocysteine methyltransferase
MYPTAAVCGLYLSHPESTYFGTGKIDLDQLESYAQRKAWDMDAAKKWLGPILV